MVIDRENAIQKIEKMALRKGHLEFYLLPNGFLRMKQEKAVECGDYRLFYNGKYYLRNLSEYKASVAIPENGKRLCMLGSGKYLAEREDDSFEYSTEKKHLEEDFCMVLLLRAMGMIIFLLADGSISHEAFLVTFRENTTNDHFCQTMMKEIVGKRCPEAVRELFNEKETEKNGKEE